MNNILVVWRVPARNRKPSKVFLLPTALTSWLNSQGCGHVDNAKQGAMGGGEDK